MEDYIINLVGAMAAEKTGVPKAVSFVDVQARIVEEAKQTINTLVGTRRLRFHKGLNQVYFSLPENADQVPQHQV